MTTDPFGDAFLKVFGRPLRDDHGSYNAASAEQDPNAVADVSDCEAREMQQRADDRTSDVFGPDRARCS